MTTVFQEVNRLTRQSSIKASNKTMYISTEKTRIYMYTYTLPIQTSKLYDVINMGTCA